MSTRVEYDPALFVLKRRTAMPSDLDDFLLGESVLGSSTLTWQTIPAATVTFNSGYTPDENGTLIVDSETMTISLSFWDEVPAAGALYPGNFIECRYDGKLVCSATIDSVSIAYYADPAAVRYGADRRCVLTATAAGKYAVMMGRQIKWTKLPKEPAINRIRRWCTVNGW